VATEDILLAALRAFAERGYDGMSIRELNQRLGVSHNLIFQRFGRKEQLWRATVDHFCGALNARLAETLAAARESTQDRLETFRSVIVTFVVAITERPELPRLMNIETQVASDRLDYLFDNYIKPMNVELNRICKPLVEEGVIAPLPRGSLFFLIVHGVAAPVIHVGLSEKLGIEPPADREAVRRYAEQVTDALINGLRVR